MFTHSDRLIEADPHLLAKDQRLPHTFILIMMVVAAAESWRQEVYLPHEGHADLPGSEG